MVERHGVLYAREYGWDDSFERLVARIAADFDPPTTARGSRPSTARAPASSCACTTRRETAKLRTLLVEPEARGLGLGTRLVDEVIQPRASGGYRTLTLWTNDILHAARRIYEREGFTLAARGAAPRLRPRPHRADLVPYPPIMDRDALRALQAPLKESYKDDPDKALITLKADGHARRGRLLLGRHRAGDRRRRPAPATGGDGTLLCSGDMLLEALVACAGVTLGAVARASASRSTKGGCTPRATSTSAARSASTRRRRSGFRDIRLSFELETDADDEQLATLLKLTERYCVVLQTLARGPRLDVTLERATHDGLERRGPAHVRALG